MLTVRSTIEIASQASPQIIPVVQGDTGREILFTLADFTIPTGATATFYIQKPSGNAVYNTATIDGNTVLVELTAQSIIEIGDNYGQVRISKNSEVVTSFDFILLVKPFRGIEATESTTEMNIFDQAVAEAMEQIDSSLDDIVAEDYNSTSTYDKGEYCLYDGKLYVCSTAITTAEAWNSSHWTAVTVGEELSDLKQDIGDLDNLTTTAKNNLVAAINEAAQSGGGGGGDNLFCVNITIDDGEIDTVDKSYAEIAAAKTAGKYIYALVNGDEFEFAFIDTEDSCAWFRYIGFYGFTDRVYEWRIGVGQNNNVQNYTITDSFSIIAPEFSTSTAYSIGQYCRRNGNLYRFTSAHSAGAWNSSHVTEVTVCGELGNKISAPSSPTSGQFLKWNGSAWVASDLPVYSGGVS